jgi:MFS transporter, DHA1 family, multidrug resistance protein
VPANPPLIPPRPRGLLVANLLAQLAFGLLAMTICIPSMQQWGAIFGASQAAVQLTFSAYVMAYGGVQLLYGPLSDRLGRKPVLLAGLVLALLGSAAAALATTIEGLTVARAVQGAGAAAGMVVGRALVQDLFQGPDRTRVMAWVGMAMGLCPPLATILGGQVHVHGGWSLNFWGMAVLSVLLWLAAWRGLPDARPATAGTAAQRHWMRALLASYVKLAREPRFLLYVAILGLATAVFYAFLAGAPLVLGSQGVGPDGVGFYIMCIPLSYIVGNFLTSRLVRRLGDLPMMVLGHALAVAGLVLMIGLALGGWRSPLGFALPLVLLGLGHGFLMPATLAGTVGVVPALAGSAAAVGGLMQQVLGALGAYTVGLVGHDGPLNLGWQMLGYTGCAALALLWLWRTTPRADASRGGPQGGPQSR